MLLFRISAHTRSVATTSHKDAETVFLVRALLVAAIAGVVPVALIGAVAKLIAPGYDAGGLAWDIGWPLGFLGSLVAAQIRHRRRVALSAGVS